MTDRGATAGGFTIGDFGLRLAAALALVLLSFNPSGYCYLHWLRQSVSAGEAGALHAVAGIALLIGWVVFLRATSASLGKLGVGLAAGFLAALVWLLVDFDLLVIETASGVVWVVLFCVAVVLALGMSWGHWRRQASGQVEVDDIET